MEEAGGEKPLKKMAEAFEGLAISVNTQGANIEVAPFSHACSLVSPLFSCLGIAFKFAEMDYVAKVSNLAPPFPPPRFLIVFQDLKVAFWWLLM